MNVQFTKELKQISSFLFSVSYRHEIATVFDDWLTMCVCALGHGTNEERYLETVKRYSREELTKLVNSFGELFLIYSNLDDNQWSDPLGFLYEEITAKRKSQRLGQFFTPEHLCDLITQINAPSEWGLKINEPACGSGRMILSMNAIIKGNEYIAQDIDPICCKMTALNMAFHRINGRVYQMDVLANSKPENVYLINHEFWKHKTINILQY